MQRTKPFNQSQIQQFLASFFPIWPALWLVKMAHFSPFLCPFQISRERETDCAQEEKEENYKNTTKESLICYRSNTRVV